MTNELCGLLFNISYPQAVHFQYQDYTHGCTGSFHSAICTFKTMDCCVNIYNGSYYSDYVNTTGPALWSACGIPTPGFCPSALSSQTTKSPNDYTVVASYHQQQEFQHSYLRQPDVSAAMARAPTQLSQTQSNSIAACTIINQSSHTLI